MPCGRRDLEVAKELKSSGGWLMYDFPGPSDFPMCGQFAICPRDAGLKMKTALF